MTGTRPRDAGDWQPTQVALTIDPPPFEVRATEVRVSCGETFCTVRADDGDPGRGKWKVYDREGRGYGSVATIEPTGTLGEAVKVAKDRAYRLEVRRLAWVHLQDTLKAGGFPDPTGLR